MRLLLTSAGITDEAIAQALANLVGKPFSETSLVFIPTAANRVVGDKSWLIQNIIEFKNLGLKSLDMVDIAGLPQDLWLPHLEAADIICFGGGDETYLSRIMHEQNLPELLPDLLQDRVYMGISAGSMVAGQALPKGLNHFLYAEDYESDAFVGLELYDFSIIPHYNSPEYPNITTPVLDTYRDSLAPGSYALSDDAALTIQGGTIQLTGSDNYWHN